MNTAIIDKIRKLRVLATSDNVNEAAAAAAAAERLIQEHDVAEAEIEAAGDGSAAEVPTREDLAEVGSKSATWQAFLSSVLERSHGCAGFQSTRRKAGVTTVVYYVIVGRPSDVSTVRYLFTWLSAEIERLCAADCRLSGRTARNSFRIGAVEGIRDAMYEARKTARAVASSAALVVIDDRLAAAKAALPNDLKSGSSSSYRVDSGARDAGRRAGRSIHTGGHLGAANGARRLGA